MIEASGVSLVYQDSGGPVFACRDVDLSVGDGEFLGILGPSGSGKSSLLYLLSGLKRATSGSVRIRGREMSEMSDRQRSAVRLGEFGFVFQQPYLLGYLSALENVLVPRGEPARASELLDKLGVADKAHRLPHELSGGERQRVCVARALVGSPTVVFADEPTAALDHATGAQVVELLDSNRGSGALVMVTHDPSMLSGADRIVHLMDGAIVEEG